MVTLLLCLAWGTLVFFFVLLVRMGAKPAPKPPELLQPWDRAACQDDVLRSSTTRYVALVHTAR
jgi:hypothetical protein